MVGGAGDLAAALTTVQGELTQVRLCQSSNIHYIVLHAYYIIVIPEITTTALAPVSFYVVLSLCAVAGDDCS